MSCAFAKLGGLLLDRDLRLSRFVGGRSDGLEFEKNFGETPVTVCGASLSLSVCFFGEVGVTNGLPNSCGNPKKLECVP